MVGYVGHFFPIYYIRQVFDNLAQSNSVSVGVLPRLLTLLILLTLFLIGSVRLQIHFSPALSGISVILEC